MAWAALFISRTQGFLRTINRRCVNQSTFLYLRMVDRTVRPAIFYNMKKLFSFLIACFVSIAAYAWDYTAQCKMGDGVSYVVASQSNLSPNVTVNGYGQAANCTVVITTVPRQNPEGTPYTYKVTVKDGYGEVQIKTDWRVSKVENIVCY